MTSSDTTFDSDSLTTEAIPIVVLSIESLVLALVVIVLLRRYISFRTMVWYASSTPFVGWFLSFSIVFLIPLDLSAVR